MGLEEIWKSHGQIWSKRLHPFMAEGIQILERYGELEVTPAVFCPGLSRAVPGIALFPEMLYTWCLQLPCKEHP